MVLVRRGAVVTDRGLIDRRESTMIGIETEIIVLFALQDVVVKMSMCQVIARVAGMIGSERTDVAAGMKGMIVAITHARTGRD